jgi:cysteine desulfurase/selenocysteine lyase
MIKNIKKQFPWFKKNKGWTYLDSGATSLKPQCVIDRVVEYYECESTNPHNTDSELTRKVNKELDDARKTVAKFFNASKE